MEILLLNLKKCRPILPALIASLIFACLPAGLVNAASLVPDHKSYTTTYYGDPAESPAPYVIDQVITGETLGCGNFSAPVDVFAAEIGRASCRVRV